MKTLLVYSAVLFAVNAHAGTVSCALSGADPARSSFPIILDGLSSGNIVSDMGKGSVDISHGKIVRMTLEDPSTEASVEYLARPGDGAKESILTLKQKDHDFDVILECQVRD